MATTNDLQNIKKVFGEDWTPSVSTDLQNRGIYGAVRVAGSNDVYTIGSGGSKLTPETYQQTFGTLNQKGIVGEITPEQAAQLGINTTPANTVSVNVPETIPSSLIDGQKTTTADINNLIAKRNDIYTQLQNAQTSQEVTDLQNEYATLESQIDQSELAKQAGLSALEGQGRGLTLGLVRGQQAKLEEQANIKLQSMYADQKNLLTRLGFAKEAQSAKQQTLKDLLSYTTEDLNIQFKIQDRIDTQIKDYQTRLDKQSEDAKSEIENIVNLYAKTGKDFNDLSDEDKLAITNKAVSAGLDLNLLQYGLKAAKDQYLYDQTIQQKKDALDIAQTQAQIAASNRSNRGTTKEEVDYSNPILALYATSTGNMITSRNEAAQVVGIAQNAIAQAQAEKNARLGMSSALTDAEQQEAVTKAFASATPSLRKAQEEYSSKQSDISSIVNQMKEGNSTYIKSYSDGSYEVNWTSIPSEYRSSISKVAPTIISSLQMKDMSDEAEKTASSVYRATTSNLSNWLGSLF